MRMLDSASSCLRQEITRWPLVRSTFEPNWHLSNHCKCLFQVHNVRICGLGRQTGKLWIVIFKVPWNGSTRNRTVIHHRLRNRCLTRHCAGLDLIQLDIRMKLLLIEEDIVLRRLIQMLLKDLLIHIRCRYSKSQRRTMRTGKMLKQFF